MFVFHAVMERDDHGGPREIFDLGLFGKWSDARDTIEAAILDEGGWDIGHPDMTVDEAGMVRSACWDVGDGASFYITRREVR